MRVGQAGSLSLKGKYPVPLVGPSGGIGGLTVNPKGTRLYLSTGSDVIVYAIGADGSLSHLQDIFGANGSYYPLNGIIYASLPAGGDFIFLNHDSEPNQVTVFKVIGDGLLEKVNTFDTGAPGCYGCYEPGPSIRYNDANGPRLFVLNRHYGNWEKSITVFDIDADGNLLPISGSPFTVIDNFTTIAVDPFAKFLYGGRADGCINKYSISPEGSLSYVGGYVPVVQCGWWNRTNGVEVTGNGKFVTVSTNYELSMLDSATMKPLAPLSPRVDQNNSNIVFNDDESKAFIGMDVRDQTSVKVYAFGEPPARLELGLAINKGTVVPPGDVRIEGSLICTRSTSAISIAVNLRQRIGRKSIVEGTANVLVEKCDEMKVYPWSVTIKASNVPFGSGQAVVNVSAQANDWLYQESVPASISQGIRLNSSK